jgi:osmoprotectant transport system permease protein
VNSITSWFEYVEDQQELVTELTVDHATLVLQVMGAAILFAVGLGILVHRNETASNISLSVASVFLTIPSLALFTLFIPFFGIGVWPARVALFMYALLPILRNTVTGLQGVDPAVEESAKGMGMGKTQRLLKVKLPLAWPVVITGIRVSTLLINRSLQRLGLPNSWEQLWTGVIFIVLLALVFDLFLVLLRRFTTPSGIR